MNRREACRILGVPGNFDPAQLKKRYRHLLHLVHPDGAAFRPVEEEYPYGIHEIQAAYRLLSEEKEEDISDFRSDSGNRAAGSAADYENDFEDLDAWMRRNPEYAEAVWDAEKNEDAFCEREILQYSEDMDGGVIGVFTLIRGKFLWKPEEEFPFFLQSISRAIEKILAEIELETEQQLFESGEDSWDYASYDSYESHRDSLRLAVKKKLTYLLSQQFIDAANTLNQILKDFFESHFDWKEMVENIDVDSSQRLGWIRRIAIA